MRGGSPVLLLSVGLFASSLGLFVARGKQVAAIDEAPSSLLSQAPVAAAYDALREHEQRNERRFEALVDTSLHARRTAAIEAAIKRTDPEAERTLAAFGLELFLEDVLPPTRIPLVTANRCMSCHYRAGPGGAGGLVDSYFDGLNPPALRGASLLERLAAEMTVTFKAQARQGARLSFQGIDFGTAADPQGIEHDLVVRPFARKGRWSTVEQAVDAMADRVHGGAFTRAERAALTAWIETLPPPIFSPPDAARTPDLFRQVRTGRTTFQRIGCASCHVPELELSDGTVVAAYSDLRRHRMRDGEWMTAPLWGLAATAPYLHDGSGLASLDLAIEAHGGEAGPAADRYRRLDLRERGNLKVFLLSLAPEPKMQVAGR